MTAQANPSEAEVIPQGKSGQPRHDHLSALATRLVTWCETCVDYYQAAVFYQELSALSDAELQRRGLSRATLGRDVCAACDRSGKLTPRLDDPRCRQRGEQAIADGGHLGFYLRGWAEADPEKISAATADGMISTIRSLAVSLGIHWPSTSLCSEPGSLLDGRSGGQNSHSIFAVRCRTGLLKLATNSGGKHQCLASPARQASR